MILVIHRKKLITAAVLIISLLFFVYFSLKGSVTAFFETAQNDGIKTVIIDSGHGGEDPGAVSDIQGIKEKDVNLKIALFLKDLLEKENYKIILTRSEDVLKYEPGTRSVTQKRRQDLNNRKKLIDASSADIVVSIHLNKYPKTQYSGAQAFFPANSPDSTRLADCIQYKIRELLEPDNKREALVKKEPIIIFREPKIPIIVVECGFLSNAQDEAKLATEDYQMKIASAIKEGIKFYFDPNSIPIVPKVTDTQRTDIDNEEPDLNNPDVDVDNPGDIDTIEGPVLD